MSQRLKPSAPCFSPITGLMPSGTVKDQLQAMLDAGLFDSVDSMVLSCATPDTYNSYHAGKTWDCLALHFHLGLYLQEQLR